MRGTVRDDAVATASGWYARLHADDASEADHIAFRDWRGADRTHAAAWTQISRIGSGLDAIPGDDRAALLAGARVRPPLAAARHWPGYAIAAALLLTLGTTGALIAGQHSPPPVRQAIVATATGHVRHVRLPDGSTMTVDAQSFAVVDEPGEQRRLRLHHGRALFAVRKDAAHPFVVMAGKGMVTALGTQFSVEVEPGRLSVALVEGSVRVDLPGTSRTLVPGDVLVLANDTVTVQAGAAAISTEWQTGTLMFDSLPLSVVAERLNHYSPQRIVIVDPALAQRPFSGVLHTQGGADALIAALGAYRTARVTRRTPDRIMLAPY